MSTTRRTFLKSGALLAAAATAGESLAQNKPDKPWKCSVGLNGFMSSEGRFHHSYPIWEILDFTSREGFDGVELVEGWPHGPYPKSNEAGRIAALKRMYETYGLRPYTFQTGGADAHAADPARREAWLAQFSEYLNLAHNLGCDFIGHWPGGDLAGNTNLDAAIAHLIASYREAAKRAADAGLYFSFEIEPPFVFNTFETLQRILAEVDHPACKTNFDPSHFDLMWESKGKPHEMLLKLGVQNIGHVHLTDCDGTLFEGTSKHLACGDGHCDIPAALKTLWDGGYRGWIMIDAWMIDDAYDAYRKGKAAVDAALKAAQG